MDLQTLHLEGWYHEVFLYFFSEAIFPKIVVVFLRAGVRKSGEFNESCSLISGTLQGLVKIWKKYMEVNNFLLLILQPGKITFGRMIL